MSEKYAVSVKDVHAHIFRQHVREIMKEDGFRERVMMREANLMYLCHFEKGDDVVSLTITSESVEESKIEVRSETHSVREVVLKTVAHTLQDISTCLLEPLLPPDKLDELRRVVKDTVIIDG
jgi:hypothetical protein